MRRPATIREKMKMTTRAPLLLALGTLAVTGCLQKLDAGASSGTTPITETDGGGIGAPFQIIETTPPIAIKSDPNTGDPVGPTTDDPCVKVIQDSVDIRTHACGLCHEASTPTGTALGSPLNHILENDSVVGVMANQASFPGWKYIVPGDPENSLIYHRAAVVQDMPKVVSDPTMQSPHLSISEMSVLRQWIMCLGAPAAGGTGGTTGATGQGGATGAGGMTGSTGAGGATNASGGATGGIGGATGMGGTTGAGGAMAADGGTATPCTGVANCQNPMMITVPYTNNNFGQAALCLETTQTVAAVSCSNINQRQVRVNGVQVGIAGGICNTNVAIPAPVRGGYCIQVTGANMGGQGATLSIQ
jgi:hypothetical protein